MVIRHCRNNIFGKKDCLSTLAVFLPLQSAIFRLQIELLTKIECHTQTIRYFITLLVVKTRYVQFHSNLDAIFIIPIKNTILWKLMITIILSTNYNFRFKIHFIMIRIFLVYLTYIPLFINYGWTHLDWVTPLKMLSV